MSEAIKETICTRCIHRDICKYKTEYLDTLKYVANIQKSPHYYDFIENISVNCKYIKTR